MAGNSRSRQRRLRTNTEGVMSEALRLPRPDWMTEDLALLEDQARTDQQCHAAHRGAVRIDGAGDGEQCEKRRAARHSQS